MTPSGRRMESKGASLLVRRSVISVGDRTAPRLMQRLRMLKTGHDPAVVGRLRETVDKLNRRVDLLEAELDEVRRDNVRLAELTDVVEQHLAQPTHPSVAERAP